jgi:hypothetical protein
MKQGKKAKIANQDLLEALGELEKIPGITSEDKLLIQKLKNETNQ